MLNALKNMLFFRRYEYIYSKKPYIFTIYNPHKKYLELVKKNDANNKKNVPIKKNK